MSNKRRRRHPPSPGAVAASGPLSDGDAVRMRQMLAEAGAPGFVLDAIQPGMGIADVLAAVESRATEMDGEDLLSSLDEAMEPALARRGDPFLAEAAALELLSLLTAYVPADEAFTDSPALVAKVIELIVLAEKEATPAALALLRTIAVHGPREARSAAAAAADRLVAGGLSELPFTEFLGRPTPKEVFNYGDIFGAQESIAVTFAYGRKRHAVCVLIDHDLGGGVKDCWITEKATEIKRKYRSMGDAGMAFYEELPLADGLAKLQAALAAAPCPVQDDQVRDTQAYLPMLRQRVALVAESVAAGAP
jgi:hypothetical protein